MFMLAPVRVMRAYYPASKSLKSTTTNNQSS